MNGYLLDTNVLIALLWPPHAHHNLAVKWFTRHRSKGWATCALTQAGFVRITSNPSFSRDAASPREAASILASNSASKDHQFWPDDLSFSDAITFAGTRLLGHQQTTDAYLLGLAIHHNGKLATLDQRIETLTEPNSHARKSIELISATRH
jgi:toxin-antitoxin system PIN domain toxin